MLLDWQGQRCGNAKLVAAATLVESTVGQVLENPLTRTRDIGGSLDTDAFTDAVIGALGQK
jgi:isocitrate/isopropylmalate dehydrogenase